MMLSNGKVAKMPNKLTDTEIVKALECCIESNHLGDCFWNDCPMISEKGCKVGEETLYPYALDLINRLQAENERLNTYLDIISHSTDKIKAEAYKEFADKLKLQSYIVSDESQTGIINRYSVVTVNQINNLLKEMVGEDNAT